MKSKNNIKLNINKDDSSLNDFLSVWEILNNRPNKILIHGSYDPDIENYLNKFEEVNRFTEIICLEVDDIVNDKILIKINENIYLSYIGVDRTTENAIVSDITLFYKTKDDLQEVDSVLKEIENWLLIEQAEVNNKLNVVTLSSNVVDLEQINSEDIDNDNLEEYYSKPTFKSIKKLLKKLKKQNGLSILYGERGTGKSSVIKYISSQLDKKTIFIPNNLLELTINSPEFVKFLKKYDHPTIVLDDCEMIFNEYFTKSNLITNNLLQLVDGLMTTNLKINIITIFNVDDKSEIDHNLIDCNNLLDIIEFTELSEDEANQLSELLGYKSKHKSSMRLTDIVNNNKVKTHRRLGF